MDAKTRSFGKTPERCSDFPARKPEHFFKGILDSTLQDRRVLVKVVNYYYYFFPNIIILCLVYGKSGGKHIYIYIYIIPIPS